MANNARKRERKLEKEKLYEEGQMAFYAGLSLGQNPYYASVDGLHWADGWHAAARQKQSDEEDRQARRDALIDYLLDNEIVLKRLLGDV